MSRVSTDVEKPAAQKQAERAKHNFLSACFIKMSERGLKIAHKTKRVKQEGRLSSSA